MLDKAMGMRMGVEGSGHGKRKDEAAQENE